LLVRIGCVFSTQILKMMLALRVTNSKTYFEEEVAAGCNLFLN